jgi:GT2 family glycosyltransferase
MISDVVVIAIVYREPDYATTHKCLQQLEKDGIKVIYVERSPEGIGSLAEAINRPFKDGTLAKQYEFAFIVTNIIFDPLDFNSMLWCMRESRFAAISPTFHSDHKHVRPTGKEKGLREVPFVEFTCLMVRTDVMTDILLDERMPYWGHDLDFGHRARKAGHKIGVLEGVYIVHEYIRNNDRRHELTQKRWLRRRATNEQTRSRLIEKYGIQWEKTLLYRP